MSEVDFKQYEHSIRVRRLRLDDLDDLVALGEACFPGMVPWERQHVESHLDVFPEGQLVVELDGKLVASSASLIIDFDEYDASQSWEEVTDDGFITNHDPDGDTLYGIEIMVHPDYRGMKLARRLYDARKQLCRERNLRRIVVGGRIPGYHKVQDEMTPREYLEKVLDQELRDPVLTVQLANGFTVKRLVRSYLKTDAQSAGWATLLEWVNLDYQRHPKKRTLTSHPVRICVVQYQMRPVSSFDEFAQQCEYFVDVASGYKSDFVLFPELLTNQMLSFLDAPDPAAAVRRLSHLTGEYLDLFSRLAVRYNVNVIGGSHPTEEDGAIYNVSYLFQRSGELGKQYKLHITPNERRWWGMRPGHRQEVFQTDAGPIAIQICYDSEFPELARYAVHRGARILFVPFCTDERQGYLRVRYCTQARCIENQIYAALAGTVGNMPAAENMDIQYAQSAILTPSDFSFSRDAVGAECTPNIETVVIHDVDLETLERFRRKGTVLNWQDRRTDLYEVVWKGEVDSSAGRG